MRTIKAAVIQMACMSDRSDNIRAAAGMVRKAAAEGARIILLPELFSLPYFCQERRYSSYALARSREDSPELQRLSALAAELEVVLPVSFFEKDGTRLFNSVGVIDADGRLLGVYRKTHIPDDHYYQEKFYFSPGDTGFRVWRTRYGRIGVGICWDQWFPETARAMALQGAELLLFPTAIGSEPILDCDSSGHWTRVMQGHAAANLMPVLAANRIGAETIRPDAENGGQRSSLTFYGSSFLTDGTGRVLAQASADRPEILIQEYDLEALETQRLAWGLFRDRRPECYAPLCR